MSHYKLLVTEQILCDEFTRLAELASNPSANWNSDRHGYIAGLLLESFNLSMDKIGFIKQTLDYSSLNNTAISVKQKRVLSNPLLGKGYSGGENASSVLRTLTSLIELHLSSLKVVQFRSSYQQNFSLRKSGLETSALFMLLPDLMKCLLVSITPATIKQFGNFVPAIWVKSYDEHIASLATYKSQTAAISAYRRLVFTMGLSKFSSLTDEMVKEFRLIDDNGSYRSYGTAVAFLRDLGAIELTAKGIAATQSISNEKTKKHYLRKLTAKAQDESDSLYYRLSNDGFYYLSKNTAKQCCGLKGVLVSVKRKSKGNKFSFGDYEFNDKWTSYSLDSFKGFASR